MYRIGIIKNNELEFPTYYDALEEKNFGVEFMHLNELEENLHNLDVFLIEEGKSLETCELILKLRKKSSGLIWILSEEISRINKVVYFELGVDGVADIGKEKEVFVLQLSNILKRIHLKKINGKAKEIYPEKNFSLVLNPNTLSVSKNGKEDISLTPLEFKTLSLLLNKRGQMVPYKEIYRGLWDGEKKNELYRVNNLICNLRKKLKDSSSQFYIQTVRSKGYMLKN